MTAFFDLDRTVLDVNSGRLWIRSEVRLGYLGRRQAARAAFHLARYHLGFARIEPVIRDAVATLAGTPEAELAARTEAFYHREVARRVRPGLAGVLARHRAAGEPCVLLTTSSSYLAGLFQRDLGFDDSLCNRFEVAADGRFTGAPREPLCYGAGKVQVAEAWARARGIRLADCAFYTDSFSDAPMLAAVGRPVAVHPDPRLARLARRRGWPCEAWGTAAAPPPR
ncbi:MAG: HAD-IB family hydrolase [bacterium]